MLPIGMKRTARQRPVHWKGQLTVSHLRIPHLERAVIGGGDNKAPIGTHRTGRDRAGMAGESEAFGSRGGIPHLERVVSGGGDDEASIGTHRAAVDPRGMALKGSELGSCGGIPHFER